MMTVSEKVAYVKGLAEGLAIDDSTKEGKVLAAIIDVLDDLALAVDDIDDECAELHEQVDAVDEDLSDLEDFIYGDDDEYPDDEDDSLYEVECPKCNGIIYLDEEMLEDEGIVCPNCGTNLEFECDGDCEGCGDSCDK